jgi:Na+-driven multidrug efflux pump
MAANQSLISVESICFLSADGFGIAAAALVAQKLGAGEPDAAQKVARIGARDAMAALTLFGLTALALRNVILPMFSKDPEVLAIGRAAMPVLTVAQPFMAVGIVLAQALRGAGRTREALGVSVIGAVIVRLSATWLFAITMGLGLTGVWMGSTLDWIVRSSLLGILGSRTAARAAAARAAAARAEAAGGASLEP